MPIISVPKALREKLGDEGTDAFIDVLKSAYQDQKEDQNLN